MFILQHSNNEGERVFSKVFSNGCDELVACTLLPPLEGKYEIIGFCNNLFLLEYIYGDVVVWNPLLSQFTILPPLPVMKSPSCSNPDCDGTCQLEVISRICGFGFVPDSGDYKVLRITSNYYHHPTDYDHARLYQAQVYSITNGCWEEVEIGSEECSKYDLVGYATYSGGCCYWMAEIVDGGRVIVSFDLSNHKFSTIPIIFTCSSFQHGYILLDFQDSLGLVLYQRRTVYKTLYPRVRVFKDGRYQWTNDMGFKVKVEVERPLGYLRDGKVLLLVDRQGKLLMYDSDSQKLSKVDQLHDHPHCMQLFPLSDNASFPLERTCPRICIENTVMVETLETSTTHGAGPLFCQLIDMKFD